MNYELTKYGKEWGIFCKQSRCYVLFFKYKKDAKIKLNELNNHFKN